MPNIIRFGGSGKPPGNAWADIDDSEISGKPVRLGATYELPLKSGQLNGVDLPSQTISYSVGTPCEKLNSGGYDLAATTLGDYALFGESGVDAYNSDLVRSTATRLSEEREGLAATTVGNYALFGGGEVAYDYDDGWEYEQSSIVDAYNSDLVRSTPTPLSAASKGLSATTVGGYALFGYGKVDAYNSDLVRSTATPLSEGGTDSAATTIGNYALFAGGTYYNSGIEGSLLNVDAYNSDLVRIEVTDMSSGRRRFAATTIGNYALFGGGGESGIDAYNSDLVRSTNTSSPSVRGSKLAATSIGNFALFGGGSGLDSVYAYNTDLVSSMAAPLSVAREGLAATTIGNYALFGGGTGGTDAIDAYIVA